MKIKAITKKVFGFLLALCALGSSAAMTACTTSYPEVKMTLSFGGEEYVLNYKLSRKIAPSTTQHFLELVEHGYYDGLCIHNYSSSMMYTGGYTYDAKEDNYGGLIEKNYFDAVSDWNLTQTVWTAQGGEGLNTVYGEFLTGNRFSVENGALSQAFGSLTMHYTAKSQVHKEVYVKCSNGTYATKDYVYNSATSLIGISLKASTTKPSSYCVFATLKNVGTLNDLLSAIDEYVEQQKLSDDDFTFTKSYGGVPTDAGDKFVDPADAKSTYAVPQAEIRIVSAKVTKY